MPPTRPAAPSPPEFTLTATEEALAALGKALAAAGPGRGIRIWVEPGIRPQAKMMVDAPTERDRQIRLGEVTVLVDPMSERFVQGAQVQFLEQAGQAGFRVVGPGLPAPEGEPPSPSGAGPASAQTASGPVAPADRAGIERKVREALRQVYDPEIPMNLVDLGLIYGLEWPTPEELRVRMSLTSVGCPATEAIAQEVERAARLASGLGKVSVEVVWEPPWTPERMSTLAKRQFGYL